MSYKTDVPLSLSSLSLFLSRISFLYFSLSYTSSDVLSLSFVCQFCGTIGVHILILPLGPSVHVTVPRWWQAFMGGRRLCLCRLRQDSVLLLTEGCAWASTEDE